jgi:hypothetical protein
MNDSLSFQLAGAAYRIEDFKRAEVKSGDTLTLEPEPSNTYDRNAVKALKGDIHIGYIPRHQTSIIHDIIQLDQTPFLIVESVWGRGCVVRVLSKPKE